MSETRAKKAAVMQGGGSETSVLAPSVEDQGVVSPERPTASPMKGPGIREEVAGVSDRGERATRVKSAVRKLSDEQQN